MTNVYIGKKSVKDNGIAICKVIDSDIETGNAIIYNRETDSIETIALAEKHTLWENIRKLAEDTEKEYKDLERKAFSRYSTK